MKKLIVIINLLYSIERLNGQTVTIWSDTLDSYPSSDWDTTNTVLESSSINCPSSNTCWNVKGGGGDISRIFSSFGYNTMNITFGLNVNIGSSEFCAVYHNRWGGLWSLLKQFDSSTNKMSSKSLTMPPSTHNKNEVGIRFANTGNQQNQDNCYIDNVQVIGMLIPTSSPTTTITPTTITASPSTNNITNGTVNEYEQDSENTDTTTKIIIAAVLFISAACLIAIFCICPLLLIMVRAVVDINIDMFGIQTIGTVTAKKVRGTGSKSRTGVSYDVDYKYVANSEQDWREAIAEVSKTWYEKIKIGDQLDIKYLSQKPDWVKLTDTGNYIGILIVLIIVSAVVVAYFAMIRFLFSASVGITIAIFFTSVGIAVLCCCGFMLILKYP